MRLPVEDVQWWVGLCVYSLGGVNSGNLSTGVAVSFSEHILLLEARFKIC